MDKRVLWGGVAAVGVGVVLLLRRSPSGEDAAAMSPAFVSYVSPGGMFPDALLDTTSPTGSGTPTTSTPALTANDVAARAVDADLNAFASDSLVSNLTNLIGSQLNRSKVNTAYGVNTTVNAALDVTRPGAVSLEFTTNYRPNDPSNAAARIAGLTRRTDTLTRSNTILRDRLADARARLTARRTPSPAPSYRPNFGGAPGFVGPRQP